MLGITEWKAPGVPGRGANQDARTRQAVEEPGERHTRPFLSGIPATRAVERGHDAVAGLTQVLEGQAIVLYEKAIRVG